MCQFAHRKVSLRIFSRTSHGPRPTYSRKASADTSCTRRRIFHIRGRSVGSYCAINVPQAVEIQDRPTTDEGIPSTNINRLSFLIDSSTSSVERDFDDDFGWFRILLNECAVAAAADEAADPERDILSLLGWRRGSDARQLARL